MPSLPYNSISIHILIDEVSFLHLRLEDFHHGANYQFTYSDSLDLVLVFLLEISIVNF